MLGPGPLGPGGFVIFLTHLMLARVIRANHPGKHEVGQTMDKTPIKIDTKTPTHSSCWGPGPWALGVL